MRVLHIFSVLILGLMSATVIGQVGPSPAAKMFFVFNQPKYSPGDTAFFKLFVHAEQTSLVQGKYVVSIALVANDGTEVLTNRMLLENGNCNSQLVLPAGIIPGIYILTAYPEAMSAETRQVYRSPFVIAGEKMFHSASPDLINERSDSAFTPLSSGLSVYFDRSTYQTRSPVRVTVRLNDSLATGNEVHFAVAVLQDALFGKEIRQLFHDKSDNFTSAAVDWPDRKTYPFYFRAQVDMKDKRSLPDSTLVTFYLREEDFVYGIYASAAGMIEFPFFKDFQDDELFYQISHRGKIIPSAVLNLIDTTFPKNAILFSAQDEPDNYGIYVEEKNKIMQSYGFYFRSGQKQKGASDNLEMEADVTVDLDKFETFESMPEVLQNIVQAVKYRRSGDKAEVRVFLKEQAYYATGDPVYIIDGIMTDNTDYFLSLTPASVRRIGVIRSRAKTARYGVLGVNGVIVIETRIPDHTNIIPRTERSLRVARINKEIEFNASFSHNPLVPDMRAALYWNPDITLKNNEVLDVKFDTSDATGIFWFVIAGLTGSGVPVWHQTKFIVEYPSR